MPSEQRPPVNNGHYFRVQSMVVGYKYWRFDCTSCLILLVTKVLLESHNYIFLRSKEYFIVCLWLIFSLLCLSGFSMIYILQLLFRDLGLDPSIFLFRVNQIRPVQKQTLLTSHSWRYHLMPSCDTRFQGAFTACLCVFKAITLVWANQCNCFESAKACSKRMLKTRVATSL